MGAASEKTTRISLGSGKRTAKSRKDSLIPRGFKLGNRIAKVEVLPGFHIRLTYSDGYTGELDFWPYIQWGEAMVPLRDPKLFASAHPGAGGASLEWIGPDGEEIDFDADALRMDLEGLREYPVRHPAAE